MARKSGNEKNKRRSAFNRFQTSIPGKHVETATGAHFDPYEEAPEPHRVPRGPMERIKKVRLPEDVSARASSKK